MIRPEQMTALGNQTATSYEERVMQHLKRSFPDQCAALGDQSTRELIAYGIVRAKTHQLVTELDVCLYIDLMCIFGRDFDCSSSLPWVSDILGGGHWRDPSQKINFLFDRAIAMLEKEAAVAKAI